MDVLGFKTSRLCSIFILVKSLGSLLLGMVSIFSVSEFMIVKASKH